jgi:hypothetical protein
MFPYDKCSSITQYELAGILQTDYALVIRRVCRNEWRIAFGDGKRLV